MPYVIAICHQKGGVAKTTTTLALGACLVEQQCETLLIDLDPQANLTGGMGVDPAMMRRSAADVLLGMRDVEQSPPLLVEQRRAGAPVGRRAIVKDVRLLDLENPAMLMDGKRQPNWMMQHPDYVRHALARRARLHGLPPLARRNLAGIASLFRGAIDINAHQLQVRMIDHRS